MAENRVTRYPGMYDKDNTRKFDLPFKLETNAEVFNLLKEAYGSYGPGFQLFEEAGKYIIHADVSPVPGQSAVLAEDWLVEIGNRALELLGRTGNIADMIMRRTAPTSTPAPDSTPVEETKDTTEKKTTTTTKEE